MEFGVHLPLIDFAGNGYSLARLIAFTETAEKLGYSHLCANDHLVFSKPWLDGPTALAAVVSQSRQMTLATTVSLPVVRGPAQTAKTLGAIDILSGGRLIVGVGPGSSPRDYACVGLPFEERWKRLDEAVSALRAFWRLGGDAFTGSFYSTEAIALEPLPERAGGPPIWIGSWGSPAGLRRVARLADGWLASGYNTTPEGFAESREALARELESSGKASSSFPNGIATMWMYVTEDRAKADRMFEDVLSKSIRRPVEELRPRIPIGSADECAEKLRAYANAGAERVFLWPLDDEVDQLEVFMAKVAVLI